MIANTKSRAPAIIELLISTDWWLNNRARYVLPQTFQSYG